MSQTDLSLRVSNDLERKRPSSDLPSLLVLVACTHHLPHAHLKRLPSSYTQGKLLFIQDPSPGFSLCFHRPT